MFLGRAHRSVLDEEVPRQTVPAEVLVLRRRLRVGTCQWQFVSKGARVCDIGRRRETERTKSERSTVSSVISAEVGDATRVPRRPFRLAADDRNRVSSYELGQRRSFRQSPRRTLTALAAMGFGQLVIGPPGSGKTTYCNGIQHFFQLTGRPCAVINLDPANHDPPYECAVSVEELITLEEAQWSLTWGRTARWCTA